jgi:intermembrane space import and assembly protein 40
MNILLQLLTACRGMQDCFRRFPEVYGSELDEDEEGQAEEENANEKAMEAGSPSTLPPPPSSTTTQSSKPSPTQKAGRGGEKVTHVTSNDTPAPEDAISEKRHRAVEATQQVKELGGQDESPALVPKSAHDEASTSDGR